jgi:transposase
VECGVLVVTRWILACLRNRAFFSLAELNEAIGELLARLNQRPFKKLAGCRESLFRTIDYPAMRPLPLQRHVFSEWKKVRMGLDYHVDLGDGYYYSAPYKLIGKELDVNFSEYVVEIFYRGQRVASHGRLHYGNKKHSTETAHMPEAHSKMAEWTPERIVNWGASVGEHTSKLIEALIKRKPHPQQAFRAAAGIIRLGKHYGNERVEAACRRAYATNAISYTSVDSILKHQLDKQPLPQDCPQSSLPLFHDNIRGPGYFH